MSYEMTDDDDLVSGDDLLPMEEAAELLGVSVDAIAARRYSLPCEYKLRDRSVSIRRRDLPAWRAALEAERVERRTPPEPTLEQRDAMQRMRLTAARFGVPSRWQS
jgi:hypothetical protein